MTDHDVTEARALQALADLREEIAKLKASVERFCAKADELRDLVDRVARSTVGR